MKQTLVCFVLLGALLAGSTAALEVRGLVVDEYDNPVAGASVELQPIYPLYERSLEVMDGLLFPEPDARVRSSAKGEYLLRVPEPGMWHVEIYADGKIPLRRRLTPLMESMTLPPAVLAPDLGVEVRVQDSQGNAVAGAKVWLRPDYSDEEENRRRVATRSSGWESRGRIGDTDEMGRVWLSRSAEQTFQVYGFANGFMPADATPVAGRTVTLKLRRGRPFRIRLLTSEGDPASQVLVQMGDPPWNHALTDDDGRVQVYLLPNQPVEFAMVTPDGQVETGTFDSTEEELDQGPEVYEELSLPEPLVIQGSVLDDQQDPIDNAWVWPQRDPATIVLTDRRGRYGLVRGSGNRWWLGAVAPGFQPGRTLVQWEAGNLSSTVFLLSESSGLLGRVVDEAGTAVSWAEIKAYAVDRSFYRGDLPTAWSGEDGNFRLQGLAQEETYNLVVKAEGFAEARQVFRPSETRRLEIVLSTGRTVVGRLVSEQGAPVVGGEVMIVPTAEGWRQTRFAARQRQDQPPPGGQTDSEGRFLVGNLSEAPLALVAQAPGFAVHHLARIDFLDGEPTTDLGNLVLEPGVSLRGQVVDSEGNPVVGAKVVASRNSYSWFVVEWTLRNRRDEPPYTSDDRGRFVLDGYSPGDSLSLNVRHEDFLPYSEQSVEPGGDTPLRIVLENGARISGRVETDWGEPVADFQVEARTRTSDTPGNINPASYNDHMTSTQSDNQGSFEFRSVTPGRVELKGRGGGYITAQPVELNLKPGQEVTDVLLRLEQASELSGTISDERARPIVQATVSVAQERLTGRQSYSNHQGYAVSDAEGRYRIDSLDAEAQDLIVYVEHGDYTSLSEPLDLEPGSNTLDLVLESGLSVSGYVLSEEGEPVSGAAASLEGGQGGTYSRQNSTLSLEDGFFEISGVAPGTYRLFAVKENYSRSYHPEPVEVSEGSGARGLTIHLVSGGTIRGRIIGVEPENLDQVHVFASDGGSQRAMGQVDKSGEFRVDNVAFGEGTIQAVSQGIGGSAEEKFTLDTSGGETVVDLEFELGGSTLSGLVLVDGEPATDMHVIARSNLESSGSASTDRAGRFEIRRLDDGRYNISLYGSTLITDAEIVDVVGDTEVTIEINNTRVTGRVIEAATGEPITGALVVVRNEAGWVGQQGTEAVTGPSGEFVILVAAEGKAGEIEARADGFAQKSMLIDTASGAAISGVELALEAAGELELDIRLASGMRPDYASVGVVDSASRVIFADALYSQGQRAYRLSSIPPGNWTLLVSASGGATVSMPISVPGPPVSVTLPPEALIEVDLSNIQGLTGNEKLRLLTLGGEPFAFPVGGSILYEWPLSGIHSTIPSVPAGSWMLELVDSSGQSRQQPVTTIAGQTSEVMLN